MNDLASPNFVSVRVDGSCGTIILNRTTKRNALTRHMLQSIQQGLDDLHQQPSVRAIIITGAGNFFCAGTDLGELNYAQGESDAQMRWFEDAEAVRKLLVDLLQFPKPILSAVNGPARGLGFALALASDIVLASSEASFGLPEVRLGLTPAMTVPLLAFRIGAGRAAPMALRGYAIDAEEALQLGFVHELVQPDLLWARAHQMSDEIARNAAGGLLITKRMLNETVGEQLISQLSVAAAAMATARTTSNAAEGIAAFLQKRDPIFDQDDEG